MNTSSTPSIFGGNGFQTHPYAQFGNLNSQPKKFEPLFEQQSSSNVDKQLKLLAEQIKEIKSSQTNIYLNSQITQSKRTQASTLPRKSLNSKNIPSYVITGTATCDQCSIDQLLYGFHHGENIDLCNICFHKFSFALGNKEEWIEFSI